MVDSATLLFLLIAATSSGIHGVEYMIQLDFRVVPAVVKPLETTNVFLKCEMTERIRYIQQKYYHSYEQSSTQVALSGNHSTAMIRILKNTLSLWEPIAQISSAAPSVVDKVDPSIDHTDGVITDDPTDGAITDDPTRRTFIQISWDVATADVFGTYRCDVISFDERQNAIHSTSSELKLGSEFDSLAVLLLLKHETSNINRTLDAQEKECQSNHKLTEQLKSNLQELENETASKHNELEERVKEQGEMLTSQGKKQETMINDMEREVTEVFDEMRAQLRVLFESGFLMLWPRGSYALLKPHSGCPYGGITTWKSGWRRHHTESTDRNVDTVSTGNHLQLPVLERQDGNNFVTQHFCVKEDANSAGPNWPKGSYCINKKGDCPDMFSESYIRWDEEDKGKLQTFGDWVPDGVFNHSSFTTVEYCCRNDGTANDTAYLPSSYPFYLYRYGGQCQRIQGMSVMEEFVVFDTENTNNEDQYGQVHPDGSINNVRLELCYYQRN